MALDRCLTTGLPEVYLQSSQASMLKLLVKIVNGFYPTVINAGSCSNAGSISGTIADDKLFL